MKKNNIILSLFSAASIVREEKIILKCQILKFSIKILFVTKNISMKMMKMTEIDEDR